MLHTMEYIPEDWHSPAHRRAYTRLHARLRKEGLVESMECPPSSYVAYKIALNALLSNNAVEPNGQLAKAFYQPKSLAEKSEPLAGLIQESSWVWNGSPAAYTLPSSKDELLPGPSAEMIFKPSVEELARKKLGGPCQKTEVSFHSYDPWQFSLVERSYSLSRMPYLVMLANIAGFWVDINCQNGSDVNKYSLVCTARKPIPSDVNEIDGNKPRSSHQCSDRLMKVVCSCILIDDTI
jgi:hypothetical protein